MHAENLGRILLDKTRNSGAENYGILIRLSADWMGKVDYESEIFLIQRYITLWKGTTASVDIISLSSKLFHDSCFKPAERRKYFFRYSVYVGENSFDLKQVAIISAETCQMVLNLILASICIEKNWGDEKILVIPVTWQISAQPLAVCLKRPWQLMFEYIWMVALVSDRTGVHKCHHNLAWHCICIQGRKYLIFVTYAVGYIEVVNIFKRPNRTTYNSHPTQLWFGQYGLLGGHTFEGVTLTILSTIITVDRREEV